MMPTRAKSTLRPVADTPGSTQSILSVCVKRMTNSSTMRLSPKVKQDAVDGDFIEPINQLVVAVWSRTHHRLPRLNPGGSRLSHPDASSLICFVPTLAF